MSKKQTSASHSSTVSEVISRDVGLIMEGLPAFDLWDLVTGVVHFLTKGALGSRLHNKQTKSHIKRDDLELINVVNVSANAQSSRSGAMLYIFEDSEAVIKIIIKGTNPMMRHVSRTH